MSVFARAMSLGAILIMLAAYTAPAKAQEQPQAVHGIIFDIATLSLHVPLHICAAARQ